MSFFLLTQIKSITSYNVYEVKSAIHCIYSESAYVKRYIVIINSIRLRKQGS